MKKVAYIRHAKSSWEDSNTTDLKRDLKLRGIKDCHIMRNEVSKLLPEPDIILCSPAKRAIKTAMLLNSKVTVDNKLKIDERLYFRGTTAIYNSIKELDCSIASIHLVAHNPNLHEIAEQIMGFSIDNFPTCATIIASYNISNWNDLNTRNLVDYKFIYPKMFKN